MPEQPKMMAYAVSLNFGEGGPLLVNATLAPSPEAAVAIIAVTMMQQHHLTQPLHGVAVVPLAEAWLDLAVRATKGQLPEGGAQILSLVPQTEAPKEPAPDPLPEPALSQRASELLAPSYAASMQSWNDRQADAYTRTDDPPPVPPAA